MYQEGQGLHNQCAQLKADFQVEMEKAGSWYKRQLQEAKTTADDWASNYKAELDKKFVSEREELRSKMQQEHEALQQRLRLSDKTSSDTAQRKWDEIKREMTERFNQQRDESTKKISRGRTQRPWRSTGRNAIPHGTRHWPRKQKRVAKLMKKIS